MKRLLIIGGIIVLAAIIALAAVWFIFYKAPSAFGLATSSFIKYTGDVIGTKVGTTTTGVMFSGNHVSTSTYVSKIGNANIAAYGLQVKGASSSADVRLSVLASNDDFCDTTNTDTAVDLPLKGNINWFDAAPFLYNGNTAQTLTNGTSTLNWNTSNGTSTGRTLLLTNLAAQCLRLDVNASSTELRAELRLR